MIMKPHVQSGRSSALLCYLIALAICIATLLALLYADSAARSFSVQQGSTAAATNSAVIITARRAAAGKQQHPQPLCTTQTRHISYDFELAWLGNVTTWQDSFCDVVRTPQQ
jgi:hypothetical protein